MNVLRPERRSIEDFHTAGRHLNPRVKDAKNAKRQQFSHGSHGRARI
jgi:hypothetical protein